MYQCLCVPIKSKVFTISDLINYVSLLNLQATLWSQPFLCLPPANHLLHEPSSRSHSYTSTQRYSCHCIVSTSCSSCKQTQPTATPYRFSRSSCCYHGHKPESFGSISVCRYTPTPAGAAAEWWRRGSCRFV